MPLKASEELGRWQSLQRLLRAKIRTPVVFERVIDEAARNYHIFRDVYSEPMSQKITRSRKPIHVIITSIAELKVFGINVSSAITIISKLRCAWEELFYSIFYSIYVLTKKMSIYKNVSF